MIKAVRFYAIMILTNLEDYSKKSRLLFMEYRDLTFIDYLFLSLVLSKPYMSNMKLLNRKVKTVPTKKAPTCFSSFFFDILNASSTNSIITEHQLRLQKDSIPINEYAIGLV